MEFEDIRLSEVSQAGEDVICSLTQEPKSQSQRNGMQYFLWDPGKGQGKKGMEKGWLVGTAGYEERLLRFWISWTRLVAAINRLFQNNRQRGFCVF